MSRNNLCCKRLAWVDAGNAREQLGEMHPLLQTLSAAVAYSRHATYTIPHSQKGCESHPHPQFRTELGTLSPSILIYSQAVLTNFLTMTRAWPAALNFPEWLVHVRNRAGLAP